MDGDVYINWSNKTYSDSLYWTACPATTTWNPSNPDWSWVQSSYTNSGQTVFTGAVNEGVRCYLVSAKNSDGVLSAPTQVKYTYARWMAQPYSSSPKYIASNPSSAATSYGLPLVGTTGSICSDGWHSPSTGSGTCSWHGGIKEQYAPVIIKHTPITPIIIKPIKLPSSWFPKVKCYISCG